MSQSLRQIEMYVKSMATLVKWETLHTGRIGTHYKVFIVLMEVNWVWFKVFIYFMRYYTALLLKCVVLVPTLTIW